MYGIWCTVSGGVTGTRESWMKSNGQIRLFETIEEAKKIANAVQDERMGNNHRTADFNYSARPYNGY
jgi:hypothetical protein